MKKTALYATFAAALFFTACGNNTEVNTEDTTAVTSEAPAATNAGEEYRVATEQSSVNWRGTKVTGAHEGEIELESGVLTVAGDQLTGGTVVINMQSITVTDIQEEEDNANLVGHLKSDDFFSVEQHPTARFVITDVATITGAEAGGATHNITGDLTIKGTTESVSFPATVTVESGKVTAKGEAIVDRSKYDVRYGSETFFGNLGDKAISDEFQIMFDLVAQQ